MGDLMDYINGGIEVTILGGLYYAWRKYIAPYHEKRNKLIEQLGKDKEHAVKDKYEALIKLAKAESYVEVLEDKYLHKTRGRKKS
jgi:hypothetical protein